MTLKVDTQSFNVIFDTNTEYSFLYDENCETCKSSMNKYKQTPNYKFIEANKEENFYEVSLKGDKATELFSLDTIKLELPFVRVNSIDTYKYSNDGVFTVGSIFNSANLFYSDEPIKLISFFVASSPKSAFYINEVDKNLTDKIEPIKMVKSKDSLGFYADSVQFEMNGKFEKIEIKRNVRFGAASLMTLIPKEDFFKIKDKLILEKSICQYNDKSGFFQCTCDSYPAKEFANITFTSGATDVPFPKNAYVHFTALNRARNCVLSFRLHDKNYWVLGQSFLSRHYVVVDKEMNVIELYRQQTDEKEEGEVDLFNYIVSGIALFLILVAVCYNIFRRREDDELE